jgi:hypothetical protein
MPPRTRKTEEAPTLPGTGETPPAPPTGDVPDADLGDSTEDTACGQNLKDVDGRFIEAICVKPEGHADDHGTEDDEVTWPNDSVAFDPMALCEVCYPKGWPTNETGASASCPHGSWIYPIG